MLRISILARYQIKMSNCRIYIQKLEIDRQSRQSFKKKKIQGRQTTIIHIDSVKHKKFLPGKEVGGVNFLEAFFACLGDNFFQKVLFRYGKTNFRRKCVILVVKFCNYFG